MAFAKISRNVVYSMKKVGFFGGTFDPIHFGHINLAIQLFEMHRLDEIIVCPAFCSPFKTASPPIASPEDRMNMVLLGIEGINGFKATPIEINQKRSSFTIDTIHSLQSPNIQFHLLLSEEDALDLNKWKNSDELFRLAPPLIGSRFLGGHKQGITPTKIFEISSTEIRHRLKKNLYCYK